MHTGLKQRYRILTLLLAIIGALILALWIAATQRTPPEVGRSYCLCPGEWKGEQDAACSNLRLQVYPTFAPTVCGLGLHSSGQLCFGIREREFAYSGVGTTYRDMCHGVPIGTKQCYGLPIPLTSTTGIQFQQLPCGYPCNDDTIMSLCQNQDKVALPQLTLNCWALKEICPVLTRE